MIANWRKSNRIGLLILTFFAAFIFTYWSIELTEIDSVAHTTRDYAWASIYNEGGYKGGFARFDTAIPEVRDGGLSSEVLWVTTFGDNCPGAEVGWRVEGVANPRWYWGFFDPNDNCQWKMGWVTAGTPTVGQEYQYQITYAGSGLWSLNIGGSTVQVVDLGVTAADIVQAGGEVTKFALPQFNEMGVSGFFNLQYWDLSGVPHPWGEWDQEEQDPGYKLIKFSDTSFQNYSLKSGDCNGDGGVTAADITAEVLEIFDGDGTNPAAAQFGTFEGNPRCDSNEDAIIAAADITCTVFIVFGETCGGSTSGGGGGSSEGLQLWPELTIPDNIPAISGESVAVPIYFESLFIPIGATTFSVDFDEGNLAFDPTDADGDGVSDAIVFNVPAGFVAGASFDATDTDGEIDIAIYDPSTPISNLTGITIPVTITFTATGVPNQGVPIIAPVIFSNEPPATYGNLTGVSIPGTVQDGSVEISP